MSADGAVHEAETRKAEGLMGRTITGAIVRGHRADCDGSNVLVLTMTDGSTWEVTGDYGGYTGRSCDEYREFVCVRRADA